jgi:hypothetical protein
MMSAAWRSFTAAWYSPSAPNRYESAALFRVAAVYRRLSTDITNFPAIDDKPEDLGFSQRRHRHRRAVLRFLCNLARAFGNRWQAQPRMTLSTAKNGIRIGLPRRNTMICCLSTKTSASSAARDRNRSMINPKISLNDPTSKGGSSDSPPIANRIRFTIGTG